MKIVDLKQRTREWLAWRAQGVTASEAATVLGRSPYETPWGLWAERTGIAPRRERNWWVMRTFVAPGIRYEEDVRTAFEDRHDTLVLPACAEHSQYSVIRCSFDGLNELSEPVELKVPAMKQYREVAELGVASTAFKLYAVQVQCQIAVSGADRGWLCFDPWVPGCPAIDFEIRRDEAFVAGELIPGCLSFWEAVRARKAPPLDPARDLFRPEGDVLETWRNDAARYRHLAHRADRLKALAKRLGDAQKEIEGRCIAAMGEFLLADTDDLKVTRYLQSTTDYKGVLAERDPDLSEEVLARFRKTDWRSKLTLATAKGERPEVSAVSATAPVPQTAPTAPETAAAASPAASGNRPRAPRAPRTPRTDPQREAELAERRRDTCLAVARERGWDGELATLGQAVERMHGEAERIAANAEYADRGADTERQEASRLRATAIDLAAYLASQSSSASGAASRPFH